MTDAQIIPIHFSAAPNNRSNAIQEETVKCQIGDRSHHWSRVGQIRSAVGCRSRCPIGPREAWFWRAHYGDPEAGVMKERLKSNQILYLSLWVLTVRDTVGILLSLVSPRVIGSLAASFSGRSEGKWKYSPESRDEFLSEWLLFVVQSIQAHSAQELEDRTNQHSSACAISLEFWPYCFLSFSCFTVREVRQCSFVLLHVLSGTTAHLPS